MGKHDGKVSISTALDNKGLEKGLGNISGSLGGLKSVVGKLGGAIAAAFSIKAIVQFGTESSKAAMQLSDALTGLKSILDGQGRSFSDAQSFIEEYTKDGLIPATNAITAYKNLAMRGYDDSQIRQVMLALKDASAYGRQASYTMGEAVESASEGLKNENSILVDNAGVTKNVAKMWDEYAKSIGTTANNLTQQQKIQAEVTGILEESKYQTGDAAKVAGTLSGQLQQLSFNFNNLKIAVGNIVNPIVQHFLPAVNSAISAVTRFANTIAAAVGSIFGKAVVQTNAIAESAAAGAEAQEDLAKGVTEAGKAVKKSTAGFDELNVLQSNTGSDSPGSTTTSSAGVATNVPGGTNELTDGLSPAFELILEKLRDFDNRMKTTFAPSISEWGKAFGSLAPHVESAGSRISNAFFTLRNDSLAPFGAYITTDFIPSIVNTFSTTFAPIFAEVMPTAMDIWTSDFENSCLLVSKYCDILKDAYQGVDVAFSDMCESISTNWDEYGGSILQGFTEFKDGLWDTWWYIYDEIIDPVITSCGETIARLWNEHLKPLWDGIVEFVLSVSENILALWNRFIKPVVDYVVAYLAPIITNVINGIWDAISIAFAWISDIIRGWLKYLEGVIQFIVGVFTLDWDRAWGGVKKMFEGVWTSFEGIVKGVVNAIIWVINQLIAGIYSGIAGIVNGLGSIVETVGDMLGKKWGFSIPKTAPKIPYLAQGAVLPANKPFLAMVGDQRHGTNVEAPLSTIQEAVALVMQGQTDAILAGFEASVGIQREILEAVLGIQIGDDVIGSAVARYNRKQAVIKGGAL